MSPSADNCAVPSLESSLTHLFVYGTLRRAYALIPQPLRQMRPPHVLDTHGVWVGSGVLRGHDLWDVGKYPGIVKGEAEEKEVVGDVFDVSGAEHLWDVLDGYEGIGKGFEQPQEYRREVAEVELCDEEGGEKKMVTAWVYLYNWPLDEQKMKLVPDGDYVKHMESI